MKITIDVLDDVNLRVNKSMRYQSQPVDHWRHGREIDQTRVGDCDDYVVLKAYLLKRCGVHPSEMVMGCITSGNADKPNHAVLLVQGERTKGWLWWAKIVPCEWVLDTRSNNVYATDQIREKIDARIDISEWI